jgi:hypothetical protein
MGKKKINNTKSSLSATVQTARSKSHPFGIIDRHIRLTKPEFGVYDAIREAMPIVDAAIIKIIRLVGGFKVECSNKETEEEINEFLNTVPSGPCSKGIDAFLSSFLDSLIMYGIAVGEIAVSKNTSRVQGLYNAPLDGLFIDTESAPFDCLISVRDGSTVTPVNHPERLLISVLNSTAAHPEGRSMLHGLSFVTSILLKIFDSIGNNFERIGNLRYAVTYKPTDGIDAGFGTDRAAEIAKEWSAAMSDKDGIRDFVAVGDVEIKVIGADNQELSSEIPVRQLLEQIVAKTGIPPFLLGLSWSSTERMSEQQIDILTTELEHFRRILEPCILKICNLWALGEGYSPEFSIVWDTISLKDEVEPARARLLNAQAESLERKEEA